MSRDVQRRTLLKIAGATLTSSLLPPLASAGGGGRPPATARPILRRNIYDLTADDPVVTSYRRAIGIMRRLPKTNRTSWAYQAAIHGTRDPLLEGQPLVNTCEHNTVHFWPWHRMYLYRFERIVRWYSGDPTWALPYWDPMGGGGEQVYLPEMFTDPRSELYDHTRIPGINERTRPISTGSFLLDYGLSLQNFYFASLALEVNPHDVVHIRVGGHMGDIQTAALDPIFWLHHANMDRLWNSWLAQPGGRTDPTTDPEWMGRSWSFFNESGQSVRMTTPAILDTARELHYSYGNTSGKGQVDPPSLQADIVRVPQADFTSGPTVLARDPVSVALELPHTVQAAGVVPLAAHPPRTYLLELSVEADQAPRSAWHVFVAPQDVNVTSLSVKSPYYVGDFALFSTGIQRSHNAHTSHGTPAAVRVFPLNDAFVQILRNRSKGSVQDVNVWFVPDHHFLGGPSPSGVVTVRRMRLLSEEAK